MELKNPIKMSKIRKRMNPQIPLVIGIDALLGPRVNPLEGSPK
jgi:hypothetical protein